MRRPLDRIEMLLAAALLLVGGCGRHLETTGPVAVPVEALQGAKPVEAASGKHKTAHGGVLNAISRCEIGHAEAKLEGDRLRVWLVGGAPDTDRAVPVPDRELDLKVAAPGAAPHALALKANPL